MKSYAPTDNASVTKVVGQLPGADSAPGLAQPSASSSSQAVVQRPVGFATWHWVGPFDRFKFTPKVNSVDGATSWEATCYNHVGTTSACRKTKVFHNDVEQQEVPSWVWVCAPLSFPEPTQTDQYHLHLVSGIHFSSVHPPCSKRGYVTCNCHNKLG